ncbi:MAG: glycosyltransferase family 2 protein [Pyrinomonadaceae bacterium]
MNAPEMSVVLVTPDNFETVRQTVRHLRAQSKRARIELVFVAPDAGAFHLDEPEVSEFFGSQVIEIGSMSSTARGRAAGVLAASAPVVAFAEDHAFPREGWAEALLARHAEGWTAVAPVMANANPRSAVSWANLLIEYAPWLEPCESGEREHLPGHNGSYKREALVAYGARLEAMLDAESVLHWDLRARGHGLFLEARARTLHLNFTDARASAVLRFYGGRLFAASRARGWSAGKRLAFVAGSPLIPLVRFMRIARVARRALPATANSAAVLSLVLLALVCDGTGELVGYAAGGGDAMAKLSDMEFKRGRFIKRTRRAHGVDSDADGARPTQLLETEAGAD